MDPSTEAGMRQSQHASGHCRLNLDQRHSILYTLIASAPVGSYTPVQLKDTFTAAIRILEDGIEDHPDPPQDGEESCGSES
jgi:hypothetical protein